MPHDQRRDPDTNDVAGRGVLVVGVTGHRPHRLAAADLDMLRRQAGHVLAVLRGFAAGRAVRVLSPLAAGADQLVATVALDAGWELVCPLPFPRAEYAADFADQDALDTYQALLARAHEVIELAGSRATPVQTDAAYAAVGAYTVAHAALLLAIWDGEPAHGPGGTAQVVALALAAGVPVIHLAAQPPHRIQVRMRATASSPATLSMNDVARVLAACVSGT